MNVSQTPAELGSIGLAEVFHLLKAPMTETSLALGAHTAN
jgi:hypothetical protein